MAAIARCGSLEHTPLPRLLLQLYSERYTGSLRLQRGSVEKRLLLRDGVPVLAESNRPSESLGIRLLDAGRIAREDYARLVERVRATGCKEGKALLDLGLLRPRELFEALKEQLRARVLDCFGWPNGEYELEESEPPPPDAAAFRTDPLLLIHQGLCGHWPAERLVLEMGPRLSQRVRLGERAKRLARRVGAERIAERLASALERGASLGEAVRACEAPEALALAWLLEAAGALEAIPAAEAVPGTDVDGETELEVVVAASSAPSSSTTPPSRELTRGTGSERPRGGSATRSVSAEALRRELLERHDRLAQSDLYGLLGVGRQATAAEIKRAYLAAAKRFHPDALARAGLADLRGLGEKVFAAVAQAYERLSDPEQRRAYDAELETGGATEAERLAQAELLYRKGEILLRAGSFAAAAELLEACVSLWPDEPAYRSALGWAHFKKQPPDLERARRELETAVQLAPDSAREHQRLGAVLRALGQTEVAQRHLTTARRLDGGRG